MMQVGVGGIRLLAHTEGLPRRRGVCPLVPLVALVPDAPVQTRGPQASREVYVAAVVGGPGTAGRRGIFSGQVEAVVPVRVPTGERAPRAAVSQRPGPPDVVISAIPQGVGRRAHVLRGPPGDGRPVSEAAARSLKCEGTVGLTVAGREPPGHGAVDERGTADRVRQVRLEYGYHAPSRIRTVKYAL